MSTDCSTISGPRWLLIPAVLILFACNQQAPAEMGNSGAASAQLSPTDNLLLASAKVALPPAGTRPEDLPDPGSRGAVAMQQFCTTCHALPAPGMHSATDWPAVLRRMWLRMGLIDQTYTIPVPELGDRLVMLDYLSANALKVNMGNLPDGPGRQFFVTTCSQCHELPDPGQHSSEDWYVVVRRMHQHMEDLLGQTLTTEQTEQLVQYLAGASM